MGKRACALLVFVSLAAPATAQKAAPAKTSACQAAKDQESLRYIAATTPFTKQADQIKKDANARKAKCRGTDRSCTDPIDREEQRQLREIEAKQSDENARHERAMVDIEHRPPCEIVVLAEAPCDRDVAIENRRYSLNSAALAKQKISDRNQWEHDLIQCGSSAMNCSDLHTKQEARLEAWRKDVDAENRRHQEELRLIKIGISCEPPREQPEFVSTPRPEKPREAPRMASADPTPRLIDSETKRHLGVVAEISGLLDRENQSHAKVLQQAGSDAKLVEEENQLHAAHLRLLRIMVDQEGQRFDATISRLKGR